MISGLYSCLHPYINKETGVVFTCGQCFLCRRRKAQEWIMRCSHQLITSKHATYFTLTYKPKFLRVNPGTRSMNSFDKCGTLCQRDVQLFFKRLRKKGLTFKYFYCGEYGTEKWRPHYHCVIFGYNPMYFLSHGIDLETVWGLGHVDISPYNATEKSIGYITGYVSKKMSNFSEKEKVYLSNDRIPPYIRASKGLGAEWSDTHFHEWSDSLSVGFNGHQMPVPRYYLIRQFKKEGFTYKRVTVTENLATGKLTSSLQYVLVKNPNGSRTFHLMSVLDKIRRKSIDQLDGLPISDYAKSSLSSRYSAYCLSLVSSIYSNYDNYIKYKPDIEFRYYKKKPGKLITSHPLLSDSENSLAKDSVRLKLEKLHRGTGNHHEFFDVAMDLEELTKCS